MCASSEVKLSSQCTATERIAKVWREIDFSFSKHVLYTSMQTVLLSRDGQSEHREQMRANSSTAQISYKSNISVTVNMFANEFSIASESSIGPKTAFTQFAQR